MIQWKNGKALVWDWLVWILSPYPTIAIYIYHQYYIYSTGAEAALTEERKSAYIILHIRSA